MKKATLTIGLFSLVLIATSFVTPATNNSISQNDSIFDIDGGQGRTGKKADYAFINDIDGGQGRTGKKSDYSINDIDGGQGRTGKKADYTNRLNTLAFESQVTLSKVKVD